HHKRPAAAGRKSRLMYLVPELARGARRACALEGVAATDPEIHARVASRSGLSIAAAAAALSEAAGSPASGAIANAGSVIRFDQAAARRGILKLAGTILGRRERIVFLDRYLAGSGTKMPAGVLAQRIGAAPEDLIRIETSAWRKIAIAAKVEGLG